MNTVFQEDYPLVQRDRQVIWHPFTPRSEQTLLPVVRAEGAWLYLADGSRILDAIGSWWLTVHGHGQPEIALAIAQQAQTLEHVLFAGFTHEPAVQLAERLIQALPGSFSKVFYSDDGSTATEVALKIALQYFHNLDTPRTRILALEGGYHGDTFGAMSASSPSVFNAPFEALLFQVTHLPSPAMDALACLRALEHEFAKGDVAALILEPLVQGVAGMHMYDADVLTRIVRKVHDYGALVIADEVMTGFGRTGTLFAMEQSEEPADIICLSKGLTGGFLPLGATVVTEPIYQAFQSTDKRKTFFHGHSYTANPIACAAALASLKLLQNESTRLDIDRITHAQRQAVSLLKGTVGVVSARSCGIILAIEYEVPDQGYLSQLAPKLYKYFLKKGLLLRPLGNVIYTMPPLCITDDELQYIYETILAFNPLSEL